jgi:hypothetical protein
MSRPNATRRRPLILVLAAVLGLAAVGLNQCRLVDDTVTGVDLRSQGGLSARADCVKACNDAFQTALKAENDRFHDAMDACGSDSQCKQNETAVHQANMDRIRDTMLACKNGCYNEGSGRGGQ